MAGINLVRLATKEIPYGGTYGYEVTFKNTGTSARNAIIGVSLKKHGTYQYIDLCWFLLDSAIFPAGQELTVSIRGIPSNSASNNATSALESNTYYDVIGRSWDKVTTTGQHILDLLDQNGHKVGEVYKAGSGVLDDILDTMEIANALHVTGTAVGGVDVTGVKIV